MSGVVWTPTQLLSASTVGHAIISARSLCPDPCSLLSPPISGSFSLSSATAGGSLAAGTYYVALTWANTWGETTALELNITLASANSGITVTIPSIPPNAQANIYWGTVSLNETNSKQNIASGFAITELNVGYQPLPAQNTAWLPDTDGQMISAASFYRWINEGMDELCRLSGGILDRAGIPTSAGRGSYELPSYWTHITNTWYDGWPLYADYRKNMFYYNAIAGIPAIWTMNKVAGRVVLEMWPQALRTANNTTLAENVGTTDSTINVVNTNITSNTNIVNIGCFMIVDSAQSRFPEWCFFQNQTTTSYTHVTRGVGGSQPVAWNAGTSVFESNFMFAGYRMATHYFPGNANLTLDCPPLWETALTDYILYRFKQATQQVSEARELYAEFQNKGRELAQQRQISRRNRLPRYDAGPP